LSNQAAAAKVCERPRALSAVQIADDKRLNQARSRRKLYPAAAVDCIAGAACEIMAALSLSGL